MGRAAAFETEAIDLWQDALDHVTSAGCSVFARDDLACSSSIRLIARIFQELIKLFGGTLSPISVSLKPPSRANSSDALRIIRLIVRPRDHEHGAART